MSQTSAALVSRSAAARLGGAAPRRVNDPALRRARLTVAPRLRVPTPRFPFVTLVTLIMVGGVVGLLLFNTSMQQASFAATALEQQAQSLSERQQTLHMELEDLRDPQRLAEAAREQGMVPVSRPAFLRLADGKIVGNPVAATPADQLAIDPPAAQRPPEAFPPPTVINPADTSAQSGDRRERQGRNRNNNRTNSTTD
jgi:hypothetical protein